MGLREDILDIMVHGDPDLPAKVNAFLADGPIDATLHSPRMQAYISLLSSIAINLDIDRDSDAQISAYDFALDATKQNVLLPSPYQTCFFMGRIMGGKGMGLLVVRPCAYQMWATPLCIIEYDGYTSLGMSHRAILTVRDSELFFGWQIFDSKEDKWIGTDDEEELDDGVHKEALSFVGIMALRHITKTATPPPQKLNKARKAKGQSELSTVVTVRLAGGPRSSHGSTHASPRPHWRRGHLRRLSSGKLVPIPPHPVMGDAPLPQGYIIKE